MAKRRFGLVSMALLICLVLPFYAQAISTAEAKDPLSSQAKCQLTIRYSYDGTGFPGQTVSLYQIADISADPYYKLTLTAPFAATGLELNGIQSNAEWDVIRSTVQAYIPGNAIDPIATAVTDAAGNADFEDLRPGLYFASAVQIASADATCVFDPALISLPGLSEDGHWLYRLEVAAKPQILPPIEPDEKTEFKVLKLWKGDNTQASRPANVTVEIFRDGKSVETVSLSPENNWCYSWSAADDGAVWTVIERNVPAGYTMTVSQKETTFVITNTRPTPPEPPKTGDTSNVLLYTVILYVSGGGLILLGFAGKRKDHENTK